MTNQPGQEIYVSSNGDRWFLILDPGTGQSFVRHTGNLPSGGHVTDIGLPAFLDNDRGGPEYQALWSLIASLATEVPTQVSADV